MKAGRLTAGFTVGAVAIAASLGAALGAGPALGHHSFAAEFDSNVPIEMTGVVTKVEWRNPHTYFYIDVEEEDGSFNNWGLEMGSPNGLARQGWRPSSLQVGDEVTVEGFRARDGSFKGNARSVVLSTGDRLFAASSRDEPGEGDDD
jgi:hypothetical protein